MYGLDEINLFDRCNWWYSPFEWNCQKSPSLTICPPQIVHRISDITMDNNIIDYCNFLLFCQCFKVNIKKYKLKWYINVCIVVWFITVCYNITHLLHVTTLVTSVLFDHTRIHDKSHPYVLSIVIVYDLRPIMFLYHPSTDCIYPYIAWGRVLTRLPTSSAPCIKICFIVYYKH